MIKLLNVARLTSIGFAAFVNDSQWAVNQDRPDTTIKDINGDVIQIEGDLSDNSTNIDLSGMTITLPDGKVLIADNILYDESTKTYNIDSHEVTNNYISSARRLYRASALAEFMASCW